MPRLTPEQLEALRRVPNSDRGARLRVAIALAGVSQRDIAKETGCHVVSVSRWKNGYCEDVQANTLRSLADFFGCGIDDLWPATDSHTEEATTP